MKYDVINFNVWLSFRNICIYIYIIRNRVLIIRGPLKIYDYMFYYVVIQLGYTYIIFKNDRSFKNYLYLLLSDKKNIIYILDKFVSFKIVTVLVVLKRIRNYCCGVDDQLLIS